MQSEFRLLNYQACRSIDYARRHFLAAPRRKAVEKSNRRLRMGQKRLVDLERREGRLIFLVLVIALAAAVIWIVTHLPF